MSRDVSIELLGDEELMAVLKGLPGRMGKKFTQDAWVKASKPIKAAMKKNIPHKTGMARKAVTTVRGKSYKSPTVFVGPRQGSRGSAQADAWYLKFLWKGTRYINPRTGMHGYEAAVNMALTEAKSIFSRELKNVLKRKIR